MPRPFHLGLNMAGTVSAGAYTAGVIDFLIEAMDAWYAERDRQTQQFGSDYDKWTIPPHQLELSVMAGASGGGISAALTAAALNGEFAHVHNQRASDNPSTNALFRSWVLNIDLRKLLGHADLDSSGGKVNSLLDSTPIREIAAKAFAVQSPLALKRPWVRDGLRITLTLTNLRGIPYAIEPQTDSDSARVVYHADRQDFSLTWSEETPVPNRLLPKGAGAWRELAQAAIATSAFPVVLAPQNLSRSASEYNARHWSIAQANPKCDGNGTCVCQTNEPMPPAWNQTANAQFDTLNVDGGATNNSPLDCARLELAGLEPAIANGHNPRDPQFADRAVINIAPLASEVPARLPAPVSESLVNLPGAVINALLAQSRIQGENLKLSSDPTVASRWVISPTTETQGAEPLAGALMSGFGAFVSQIFREHDYQLGRRNCQRLLTNYFGVPWNNIILEQQPISKGTQDRIDASFGFSAEADPQLRLCPLIPVLPILRSEITVNRATIHRNELAPVADLAVDRAKRVMKALLSENGASWLSEAAFNAAWLFLKGKLRDKLLSYAGYELSRQGFLE